MPRKKSTAAQREEALASASVRDQIAYEYPNGSSRSEQPLPAVVDDEGSETPQTLFERTQEAQRTYWELLSDLEDSLDVELDSTADLQSMTLEDLKQQKGKCRCNGENCDAMVGPNDPYFATPCGSFCSECMETEHASGCGICAGEFDLQGPAEEQPDPASKPDARAELERLLPGVIERKSIATGTNAVFTPDGKCLAFGWEDALRVWKEKSV